MNGLNMLYSFPRDVSTRLQQSLLALRYGVPVRAADFLLIPLILHLAKLLQHYDSTHA